MACYFAIVLAAKASIIPDQPIALYSVRMAVTCCVVIRVIARKISHGIPTPVPKLINNLPVPTRFVSIRMPPAMTAKPPAKDTVMRIRITMFAIWRICWFWVNRGSKSLIA